MNQRGTTASWWPLLLSFAYLCHLCEEWWGGVGFVAWTRTALGVEVSPTRFLWLNGLVWPLFLAGTIAAIRVPKFAWFLVTFATILVINGAFHALGSLAYSSYSPGLVTGLLLYFPIGGLVLVRWANRLSPTAYGLAVAAGFLIHALVAVIAFA